MLDSTDKDHKDPKNSSAQQIYPTTGLHQILPNPFTTDTTDVNFSISETSRTNIDLSGKQFGQQSNLDARKYVQLDLKFWPLKYPFFQKYFFTISSYNYCHLRVYKVDKAPLTVEYEYHAKFVPCSLNGKHYQNTDCLKKRVCIHHHKAKNTLKSLTLFMCTL